MMNIIQKGLFTLGTTVALTGAFAMSGQDVDAASWEARTVEEVQADFAELESGEESYTIQWGDTLSVIANAAGVDVSRLAAVNEISNANLILPGNVLSFSADHTTVSVENQTTQEVETYDVTPTAPAEERASETVQAPIEEAAPVVEEAATEEPTSSPVVEAPAAEETAPAPTPEAQAPAPQVSESEAEAKAWIAYKESTDNYNARNGRYIGKYQLDYTYLNGDYSPANQERVANDYVSSRYGSWSNAKQAWLQQGWY